MLFNYENEFNIDAPLQKYLLVNSSLNNANQSVYSKVKRYSIISLYIIYILKEISILLFFKNNLFIKTYLGDFFLIFQNSYIYTCSGLILITSNAFTIYLLFYFSSEHDLKWISIIEVLKGIQNIENLNLRSKKEIRKFVSRSFKIVKLFYILSIIGSFIAILTYLINLIVLQVNHPFYFTNPWRITDVIIMLSFLGVRYVVYAYYYVVCYKIRLEIIGLKCKIQSIVSISKSTFSLSNKTITKLFNNLAQINISMGCYNRFWKKYLWCSIFTLIPVHAIAVHCLSSIHLNTFEFIFILNEFVEVNLISLFIFVPLFKINSQYILLYKSFYQLQMFSSSLNIFQYEKVNYKIKFHLNSFNSFI